LISTPLLVLGLLGLGAFYLLNLPFLSFLRDKRGWTFALKSALFLPLDVFVVGLGIFAGALDIVRGLRY
jgi:hypothetical protein